MSKVICDICGTAYPETAAQCPICGSAKQIDSKIGSDSAADSAEREAKAPTRGGHFSTANVRKRNKASQAAKQQKKNSNNDEQQDDSNRGMVIVAWVLLIAVVLVLAYIIIQFIVPMLGGGQPDTTTVPKSDDTTAAADATTLADTTPEETGVACTGLAVSGGDITLDAVGRAWLLEVTAEPADTTDVITYASADESVATVSDQGRVTAVGPGQTVITITCGNVTKQCSVVCAFAEETTVPETTASETTEAPTTEAPTETTPPETTEATEPPAEDFGLFQQDDVTLAVQGETFYFESGDVRLRDITWTSDDPSVATVENGMVTGVGSGNTVIRGEYNGQTDSCIIRCSFDDGSAGSDEGSDSEDHPEWPHLYPAEDVSVSLGESFNLSYVNADGELPDISWYSDDGSVAVVDGNTVTGVGYGTATIYGSYDGTEITCVVRVREDY